VSRMLAVAARELRERWLLFPAGLAIGLAPLVPPAFGLPREATPAVGALSALLLGLIAALVAGASMLARDTLDGRLGFLFSRPVSWPAIWGGKWLAAIVLVAGSAGLAALPWVLVHDLERQGGSWRVAFVDPQGSTFFFLLLLLGIGFANFNATAFRSRSAWVALDLGLLLLAIWLVWRWVAPLYSLQILGRFPLAGPWAFLVFLGPPAVALVVASAAQVVFGRTDLRRAHRAMSLTFWGVIFAALAVAGLRLAWARAATPADLEQYVQGTHDPAGRWLYVEGLSRRGGGARFLIDIEDGRYVPWGLDRPWDSAAMGMIFAPDGRSGVILMHRTEHSAIVFVELGGDEPRFKEVELESSPPSSFGARLALSPSGAHVLFAHENGASLFVVSSGRRVATATVPPGWRPVAVRFVRESVGRVWLMPSIGRPVAPRSEIRILDVTLEGEPRTTAVPLAVPVDPVRAWPHLVHPDPSGRRFLTRDGGLRLRDGENGDLLAPLVDDPSGSPAPYSGATLGGLFLADGRIVVSEAVQAQTVLHVFDEEGSPLDDITLDRVPAGLAVGPEVAPGRVMVRFGYALTGPEAGSGAETLVVDLDERRVVEALPGQQPLGGFFWLDTPAHAPGASAPTVHLLIKTDGSVIRRDFTTGEERIVAGPGAVDLQRLAGP
jgi:hypothetical protein